MLDNLSGDLFFKLKIFHYVMQYGNLADAAGAVHKSPSAVSRQLQQLEEDLGTTLLLRRPEGMVPTPEGQRFYEHSLEVFRNVEAMLDSVPGPARKKENLAGTVKFLAAPVVCEYLFPRLLPDVLRRYPHITLDISSAYGVKPSLKTLSAHDCHFAIVARDVSVPSLDFRPLFSSSVCLIAPEGMALSEGAGDDPAKLLGLPFIFTPEAVAITRFVRKVCGRFGFVPCVRHRVPTMSVQVGMVRAGLGVAFVDSVHLKAYDRTGIAVLPMPAFPDREFGIVQRSNAFQPDHVRAVLDMIVDFFAASGTCAP